jgi:SpoIID/LytB domain protein
MALLAPTSHGRCRVAPGKVIGPAEALMSLAPARPLRPATPRPTRVGGRAARAAVAAIVLVIAGLLPSGRMQTASADGVPPMPDTTFYGRGYGHGVGMSQYGARGRALAGQLAPLILAHYYPGTTLGAKNASTIVRTLILTGFAASAAHPLTIAGRVGGWTIDGIAKTFPVDAKLKLNPVSVGSSTWALKVVTATGATLHRATVTGDVYMRPVNSNTLLQLISKATTTNIYRGVMQVHLTKTGMVINHLALDRYLRGVVPLEMPSSWPVEALKTQAIAARSYALAHLRPTLAYDVYDDTRSQVYRGQKAETAAGNAAIAATAGKVLLSGSAVVNAMFHSADGGWTENNENVFVSSTGAIVAGKVAYLRGSSDRAPDGSSYDKGSPYATWRTATYSAEALSAILASDARTNVGLLSAIDLSRRGVSGRLISVTLTGELGTKTVSGDVFVSAFNAGRPTTDLPLRSTLFDTAPIP